MSNLHVLILAAGQGKRMKSDLPKVLHPLLGKPMLHYVLDTAQSLHPKAISVVVGHGQEKVRQSCESYPNIQWIEQKEQKGTAHAVLQAKPIYAKQNGFLLILSGDVILFSAKTLQSLIEKACHSEGLGVLTTARLSNPQGYGRIVKDLDQVVSIREQADCTEAESRIQEVNAGVYVVKIPKLFDYLDKVKTQNQQKEYYFTDVIGLSHQNRESFQSLTLEDSNEMLGINDRQALIHVESLLRKRINTYWMFQGVTLVDPDSTWIDAHSSFENDVTIESSCQIYRSVVRKNSHLESGVRLVESEIGAGNHIKQGSYIEKSKTAAGCQVGPYAHLRPGTVLGEEVKIGNFVEVKNSKLADGVKASHLSYIGDAEVGKNTNIGCGFVTCNYDGNAKHKTVIEEDVFIGSDSQTVAPVKIGKGSYIASGTTVTEDVPADSLALSRGKQITKTGYAKKYRKTSK